MNYWTQQPNFAVSRSGVSERLLVHRETDSDLNIPPQIRSFFRFHVYLMVRRILFDLGSIQSITALPGDPTFSQTNNNYDKASYERLCAEFGIDPRTDFRFTFGQNHDSATNMSITVMGLSRKNGGLIHALTSSSQTKEALRKKGQRVEFIRDDHGTDWQYECFVPTAFHGLYQAGLARLNHSTEAFVHYVLGKHP